MQINMTHRKLKQILKLTLFPLAYGFLHKIIQKLELTKVYDFCTFCQDNQDNVYDL